VAKHIRAGSMQTRGGKKEFIQAGTGGPWEIIEEEKRSLRREKRAILRSRGEARFLLFRKKEGSLLFFALVAKDRGKRRPRPGRQEGDWKLGRAEEKKRSGSLLSILEKRVRCPGGGRGSGEVTTLC